MVMRLIFGLLAAMLASGIAIGYAAAASWAPVNFIRRNRGLYNFIKALRSFRRGGVKGAANAAVRGRPPSLEATDPIRNGQNHPKIAHLIIILV